MKFNQFLITTNFKALSLIYLYNIILILVILLLLPAFLIKLIIDRRYRRGLLERLGSIPAKVDSVLKGERPVWFHAASVGEVNASVKLISAIKARWPEKKIIVSTFTATGNAMAREKLEVDAVIYLPIDIPFIVRKVIERLNPAVLIIMETEIWPNLINEAKALNAPVVLVNGRISDSSYGKYRIIKSLLRVVFSKMSLIMTQSDEY
ncbi:MAG: 3-deoxy-D-manno-octulosonic acid transferase, partial [Proteobacteria bacterium]|nr:3-deoxy-D-manno-octulosonic acid transferase [Pseudomonadota bacterium]